MPQSKSVRIGLERLDRMMNAVGELVINRTRMFGRVAELERLADVLNFSKARMQDKISEFQEKHEFSRIHSAPQLRGWRDRFPSLRQSVIPVLIRTAFRPFTGRVQRTGNGSL